MTPARLQTVEEIFHAALDQESDRVGAFLGTACEGDEALRRKVEALLASHQRAGSFIETTVAGITTRIIENEQADLLVGRTIGHYKISERIGTGGMGDVYLATDVTAGRKAALKLLPMRFTSDAERLKRFQQEALALVGLNHPNILTVYEIGQDHSTHYIASELIEGETLRQRLVRGRMQLSEAVDVAIQVVTALAAAHEAGIVHRDIKPENIMLRPDGYVKVLDFGIAKLAESAFADPSSVAVLRRVEATADRAESMTLAETNLGSLLGTVRYMSPEQACGAPIDKRTDVWSLGVVLYEMVTGHAPFTGGTAGEVMASILEKETPPLTSYVAHTPAELQQIINKTLRKDREERFHTAHELLDALKGLRHKLEFKAELRRSATARSWLRWTAMTAASLALAAIVAAMMMFSSNRVRSTPDAPEKSIAVLPFENLSHDPDNAYFADGIQEEILTRLARISDLKVISRTSTQRYQSKPGNLREIAKQLGVATILEGSVQKAANQVRVNVQLINAQTDSHLWADTYDRKMTDIFGVESEIAKAIAESLRAKLTGREQQALAVKPTNNPEAYDAYLRGLAIQTRIASLSPDSLRKAIGFFERAVQLDPNFAPAWAQLSRAHAFFYFGSDDPTAARRDAAKRALEHAQKLEPNSPETLLALGYYQYWVLRDYGVAKTTFERVSKMLPNNSDVPIALALITQHEGNWDESVAYIERGLALDPDNAQLLSQAARTYTRLRQFPTALKLYDRALDLLPNDPDLSAWKARMYQAEGNLQEAAKLLVAVNAQTPSGWALTVKVTQLRLERNLGEAVRLLQARLAQYHFSSEIDKATDQGLLAFTQCLAGDIAGAKVTGEQTRSTFERLCKDRPDNAAFAKWLSLSYAALGNKDSALKEAEHAIMLSAKDGLERLNGEEILAVIQMIFGENSDAISTLTQLLQTPYSGWLYFPAPVTPALLRLDPLWDPLRDDPAFQKLCEDKLDKRIAVLPFENLSDPHDEYFSDGLSEELISALAQISELKVIGRSSSFRFKDRKEEPKTIGEKLGVSTLLEGTVRIEGNRVRIIAALTNPADGIELWTRTFDRELKDIFAVQEEIAKAVAESLKVRLIESDAPSQNPAAHNAVLQSDFYFQQQTADSVRKSISFLQEAVRLDPNYALAYAKLSQAWRQHAVSFAIDDASKAYDEARQAADKAISLAPDLVDARMAVGLLAMNPRLDFPAAEKEFRQVLQSSPNNAAAKNGLTLSLLAQGRFTEAEEACRQALLLDPLLTNLWFNLGRIRVGTGRYKEAGEAFRKGLELQPNASRFHTYLATLDVLQNRPAEAMANAQLENEGFWRDYAVALVQQAQGDQSAADARLKDFIAKDSNGGAFQIAVLYAIRKEPDQMFKWLDTAFATHDSGLSQLAVTPFFLPYSDDPHLTALCQKLNVQLRADPAFQKLSEEKLDKRIAVLPFENLSDPHDEYFSDGLSEELISALAQISELKVIGRSSSFRFKDRKEEPKTIGEKLGVSTLLEGTVRKQGNRVRIVAALTNAADGIELWTRTFDRELKDIFAVQEEIAKAVAESLKVRLLGSDDRSTQRTAPNSVEAHNAYLKGHFYFQRRNLEDYRKAVSYFDEAIRLDPNYALAYAERSEAWTFIGDLSPEHKEAWGAATKDAEKAVAVGPNLAEAHAALGWVRFFIDWKFADGLSELKRAKELSPANPTANDLLARVIFYLGRLDEAEQQARHAVELDPLSVMVQGNLARALFYARKLDEADAAARKAAELQPASASSRRWQTLIAAQRGDGETALREAQLEPDEGYRRFELALAHYVRGDRVAADAALADLIGNGRDQFAYQIAEVYAVRGEKDKAFEWLQIALDNHDTGMLTLLVDPLLRGLRGNSRYKAMLEKVGLPGSL